MTIYEKVVSVFSALRGMINRKADNSEIAPEFSEDAEYLQGEMVMHDDKLYQCISDHHGPWDDRDFDRKPISDIVPMKVSELDNDKGYIEAEDVGFQFRDISLSDNATQADIRKAVQDVIAAMKSLSAPVSATCLAAMIAASAMAAMPGDDTKWEDVGPTNLVKDVVVKFTPAPDFSTNNVALTNTIIHTVDFSTNNEELVSTIGATVDFSTNNVALTNTIITTMANAAVIFSTNNTALTNTIVSTVDFSTNNITLTNTINSVVDLSTNNVVLTNTILNAVDLSMSNSNLIGVITYVVTNVPNYDIAKFDSSETVVNLKDRAVNIILFPNATVEFPYNTEGKTCEFYVFAALTNGCSLSFHGNSDGIYYYSSSTDWPFSAPTSQEVVRQSMAHFIELPPEIRLGGANRIFFMSGHDVLGTNPSP